MEKNIPVLIIDSPLTGEVGKDFICFVGTNNKLGGGMAGKTLAKLLDGRGNVVLLRYREDCASTRRREEGFLETIKKHPDIQVLVDDLYAGGLAAEAQASAISIIDKLRQADGIFCSHEPSTLGMLLALRQNKLLGKIKFVGFDTSPPLVEGLRRGEIHALMAQNPKKIGYEGVKIIVAYLHGEQVLRSVDTGVVLVTQENLNSPEIQKLLGL